MTCIAEYRWDDTAECEGFTSKWRTSRYTWARFYRCSFTIINHFSFAQTLDTPMSFKSPSPSVFEKVTVSGLVIGIFQIRKKGIQTFARHCTYVYVARQTFFFEKLKVFMSFVQLLRLNHYYYYRRNKKNNQNQKGNKEGWIFGGTY